MEWIPIEREAPKDGQKILVCYEDGTILGTRYNPRSLSTWLAWMPQPKPYTTDTPQTGCNANQCVQRVESVETDTPQTETSTNSEKLQSGVEIKQTDCPWK